MNMKKFLAMTLSALFILTMMIVPASAESEINLSFVGIGSDGIAYDDLTLPESTSGGEAITWSTTTADVIEIVENNTAKIKKQYADKEINANLTATVGSTETPIDFKVGYLWADKTELYAENFDNYTGTLSDEYKYRKSTSTDTLTVENGKLKMSRPTANGENLDLIKNAVSSESNSTASHILELDIAYESTVGGVIIWFPTHNTSTAPIDLRLLSSGKIAVNGTDTVLGQMNVQSEMDSVKVYEGKLTVIIDRETLTNSVMLDGNLIGTDLDFKMSNGGTYKYQENVRIYACEASTTKGNVWIDSIAMYSYTDAFEGIEKSVLNPVEEGGDVDVLSSSITLPSANTAGSSVSWTASDNIAIAENTATPKASYFEEREGTVTASVSDNDKAYLKDYVFTIPKVDFPAASTAEAEGTLEANGKYTATINDIPVAEENLTVIMAIYNDNSGIKSLADVKVTSQTVSADGKLSVEIDGLASEVTASSEVKIFVLDGMNTLKPLTTVTVTP